MAKQTRFRVKSLFVLVIAGGLATIFSCLLRETRTTAELFQTFKDPGVEHQERKQAEDAMIALPARDVFEVVVASIIDGPPEGISPVQNNMAELEKDAPIEWRFWYSTNRVWRRRAAQESLVAGEVLLESLKSSQSIDESNKTLPLLERYWVHSAEEAVSSILLDTSLSPEQRLPSASCLLRNGVAGYSGHVWTLISELELGDDGDLILQAKYAALLLRAISLGAIRTSPSEAQLVSQSIRFIKELREARSPYQETRVESDRLAKVLGTHVGIDFVPTYDESMGGGYEAGATSRKALNWWQRTGKSQFRPKD